MEQSITADSNRAEVQVKQQFSGKVVKISLAGAVIDIGVGTPAVIHISQLVSPTNEPIKRVEDVLQVGQEIEVWVKKVKDGRVELTMIKPLNLEWREIKKDMTVRGVVVRLEKFGVFVEIGAERPGLVHISEMAHGYVRQPGDVVKEGDEIEAMVLDVNRKKKQIKLSMKALLPEPEKVEPEPVEVRPVETPMRAARARFNTQPTDPNAQNAPRRPAKKAPRKRSNSGSEVSDELLAGLEDQATVEAEPTAMEIAIRAAMEKAKSRKQQRESAPKAKNVSHEAEDIFSRTLDNKPQS
jgi:small subunit ribosomal protein S1